MRPATRRYYSPASVWKRGLVMWERGLINLERGAAFFVAFARVAVLLAFILVGFLVAILIHLLSVVRW